MAGKLNRALGKAVDAGLLAVSPRRYRLRQHFRRMENDGDYRDAIMLAMSIRGYRAARTEGGKAPWTGSNRSADGEILNDLPAMRSRARELNRDDSLGSGITETFVANVVGIGMVPQARTGDPKKNNRLEAVWKERKDNLHQAEGWTHGEAQRAIFRKVIEDGDVLPRAVYLPGEPVWIETVESERLATPMNMLGNPRIRDGVERDEHGRPVRYWVSKSHPGDIVGAAGGAETFVKTDPALCRHLKLTSRPGQTRGVPYCHAILQDLRDLDLLMVAALKRTQIAACLAAFIRSEADTEDVLDVTAKKYGYVLDQAIEPGMLYRLFPGDSVETLIPNFPTPELEPFIIMLARRIGAALGITWQMVLKDFSKSTYSSARTDQLEARMTFRIFQRWFIDKYLAWEWRIVMEDARLRGDARLDGVTDEELGAVQWIPPGWHWVDPEKEASAAEIELRIGTKTLRDLCAAQGNDWEEIQDQRLEEELREMRRRKELGLPPKQQAKPKPKKPEPQEEEEKVAA